MKLSILDQVPMPKDATVEETLDHTVKLAKRAEELGYHRYWIAEHHNTNGLLSAAPELFMTRIGAETKRIRLGSGGVLLPQYAPLKVAETFKLLEAFYPGRVDLGIGRSPGGTERTRMALTDGAERNFEEFPRQLDEVIGFLHNSLPSRHPYRMVKVTPRTDEQPPVWLLGLSPRSSRIAAERGIGLTFGHFINPDKWEETLREYREGFVPSFDGDEPRVNVCVFVVCAETEERAEALARTQDLWLLGIEKGNSLIPSVEEAAERVLSEEEREKVARNRRRVVVGTPEQVKVELERLAERYGTDDFLLINNAYGFEDRVRSYELVAEVFGSAE